MLEKGWNEEAEVNERSGEKKRKKQK